MEYHYCVRFVPSALQDIVDSWQNRFRPRERDFTICAAQQVYWKHFMLQFCQRESCHHIHTNKSTSCLILLVCVCGVFACYKSPGGWQFPFFLSLNICFSYSISLFTVFFLNKRCNKLIWGCLRVCVCVCVCVCLCAHLRIWIGGRFKISNMN